MTVTPATLAPLDTGSEAAAGGKRSKKSLLIIAVAAILLLAGGGGAAFVSGMLDRFLPAKQDAPAKEAAETPLPQSVFFSLPDLLVTLNTSERRATYLKLKVTLELPNAKAVPELERLLPRIIDFCQTYLRELRVDEVRGSAGSERLREELLRRINMAVAPVQVRDVLFTEMFLQ